MLDLLNETVEKPVTFSHEPQVLDLAFQRWVHPAFVDIWRGEELGKLYDGAKIFCQQHKFDFRKLSTHSVKDWIISFISTVLQVPLGQQSREWTALFIDLIAPTQMERDRFDRIYIRPARNLSIFRQFSVWTVHISGLSRNQSSWRLRKTRVTNQSLVALKLHLSMRIWNGNFGTNYDDVYMPHSVRGSKMEVLKYRRFRL